ncbi:hypothetical protein ACE193_10295 [Bernardetia sp. OM2101]
MPKEFIASLSIEQLTDDISTNTSAINTKYFDNREEARKWLNI